MSGKSCSKDANYLACVCGPVLGLRSPPAGLSLIGGGIYHSERGGSLTLGVRIYLYQPAALAVTCKHKQCAAPVHSLVVPLRLHIDLRSCKLINMVAQTPAVVMDK
jgi:hypothetical protein